MQQVIIKHHAGNGCRRLRAKATVFDQNGQRNGRFVGRRVGNKERMVAQLVFYSAAVVFSTAQAKDLRGAGLPARGVARAGERARAGAFFIDADHRFFDDVDVFLFPRQNTQRFGLNTGFFTGLAVGEVVNQVRAIKRPIIGQRSDRLRQLDRRVSVVALANADGDRFTGKPFLLRRVLKAALFPLGRR